MFEIKWRGKMLFEGISPFGHSILMDAKPEVGGEDKGPQPMEVLLLALGGCTGMDVISILNKMRQKVKYFKIKISSKRAKEHPKVYTEINLLYEFKGENLEYEKVKKAVDLSQNKYCSISAMLRKSAKINYEIKILE